MSLPDDGDDILAYYARGSEDARLAEDTRGRLERTRTEELLARWLPPPPAVILDVGGGTGHYALWLAGGGYTVHLIDPVPLHVEHARQRSAQAVHALASVRLGDARRLEVSDGCADAVLLLGPLYHLTQRAERVAALQEARRALRPGGLVLATAISRFASALDGLVQHLFDDPVFAAIAPRDLAEGQHRDRASDGALGRRAYFTTAYLHRPEELADELQAAGLDHVATLAIEGPAWLLQDLDAQWQDAGRQSTILSVVRAVEAEPSLLGASSHLLGVGRAAQVC